MVSQNLMESLNELVTDGRFRSIALTRNFEGPFTETGINESEHAYMLSWFMNPTGSHGLKDIFVKEFFTACWSRIHGRTDLKDLRTGTFYNRITPVSVQGASYLGTVVEREMKREYKACDLVITDVEQKILVVINNRAERTECERAYAHFTGAAYAAFENKLFVSLDSSVTTLGMGQPWLYLSNEWLINLCGTLIDAASDVPARRYLTDYYQFLTGTFCAKAAAESSGLVSTFYKTLVDLKNYRSEIVQGRTLVSMNPREYVAATNGRTMKHEMEILSLYWAHRNTFNTFFQIVELEGVTRDFGTMVEKKGYQVERAFIRNGLRFTPAFAKINVARVFDVEVVQGMNQDLSLSLVVNKANWDRLTETQRATIQKNFDWSGMILSDRNAIWTRAYKQEGKATDISSDIVAVMEKVEGYLASAIVRVA